MNNELQRIGRFEIWGQWTPELVPAITSLLERFEPLLPQWCEIAHVGFDKNMNGAECGVDFEYRRIRLTFGSGFFTGTEIEREEQFVHEMMHGYAHHLYNLAYDVVGDAFESNPTALKMARKNLCGANEGITSDLANLVLTLLAKTKS